ncbi:TPA: hypothetical protein ACH3X3_003060 [Trebouxia sp. C0006]
MSMLPPGTSTHCSSAYRPQCTFSCSPDHLILPRQHALRTVAVSTCRSKELQNRQAVHCNNAKTHVHAVCYTWNDAEMSSQQTIRKCKTAPNVLPAIALCTRYCGSVFAFANHIACM